MARLDLSMAVAMFEEQHGRKPGATELPVIHQMVQSVGILAGAKDHEAMWMAFHHPPTPEGDVKWDEFALMGCLDGPQ